MNENIFDWSGFLEDDFAELHDMIAMHGKDMPEDDIYGVARISMGEQHYTADIHYFRRSQNDQGFDLEIYQSDAICEHGTWLDGLVMKIHGSTNYKRFQERVEKLLSGYLTKNRAAEENA